MRTKNVKKFHAESRIIDNLSDQPDREYSNPLKPDRTRYEVWQKQAHTAT